MFCAHVFYRQKNNIEQLEHANTTSTPTQPLRETSAVRKDLKYACHTRLHLPVNAITEKGRQKCDVTPVTQLMGEREGGGDTSSLK